MKMKKYLAIAFILAMTLVIAAPAMTAAGDIEINVNFVGVNDVKLEYYTNVVGWKTVPGGPFNNTGNIVIPLAEKATYGSTTIRASKGGMSISYAYTLAEIEALGAINIPVATIRVYGIAAASDIGVVQNDWVYGMAAANVGAPNFFNVFNNGKAYEVRLSKAGFYPLSVTGVNVGALNADGYADVYFGPSYFYTVDVPAGVTDLRMQSNNWIYNKTGAADAQITLLRDVGNERTGTMTFTYNGTPYNLTFPLNGSNPFAFLINYQRFNVSFTGVKGVKLEYYTNVSGWKTVPGGPFNDSAVFDIPAADQATYGSTTIRASKGGMLYTQAFTLAELVNQNYVNVPVRTIRVYGIAAACDLAVVQNNWVYDRAPASVGVSNYFAVFGNGQAYEIRLFKDGFNTVSIAGVNVGVPNADGYTDVYFGPSYFYVVNVPTGVTDLRMQSNGWIHNKSGAADAQITLLRDVGNERTGTMTFTYNGAPYNLTFPLDGTNPFAFLTNYQRFNVSFTGVKGVKLEYYTNVSGWKTVPGGPFNDSAVFDIPVADRATYGSTTIRASKGGMLYTQAFTLAELGNQNYVNVPVRTIRVYGIAAACDLAVVQNNWVYDRAPASVGVSNYFAVFGNGQAYEVRLFKDGFYTVSRTGVNVGTPNADGYTDVYFGPSYFYVANVPAGVTDLRMQSNNWIHNKTGAPDPQITLLRDVGNEKTGSMTFIYQGMSFAYGFTLDGSDPFGAFLNTRRFFVNFPGVKGVKLEYYTNVSGWKTVPGGTFNDSAVFDIPRADQATYGSTTIRASKGGMLYTQAFTLAELGVLNYVNVPVRTIRVYGIAAACDLAVVQSNWVYDRAPASVGVSNYFPVFGNGNTYEVRLFKDGFSTVSKTGVNVGTPNADGYTDVYFGPSYFYVVSVPAGVTDLRMQSNGWIHNKAGAADPQITLLRDVGNEKTGTMSFIYNGVAYTNVVFPLDGTNPFAMLATSTQRFNVSFTGVKGVKLEYNTNITGWKAVPGTFDDSAVFDIPVADRATYGATTIRVSKGGMSYSQAFTFAEVGSMNNVNVPVRTIRVYGIAAACDLALTQGNWVYEWAPASVGVANYFPVFGNGSVYELRLRKDGFNQINIAGINVSVPNADGYTDVYLGPSYFYTVNVPAGVTDLRMQSNGWIHNKGGAADPQILLLRDVGNEKTGTMTFIYNGVAYTNVVFSLNGSNPFSFLLISVPM